MLAEASIYPVYAFCEGFSVISHQTPHCLPRKAVRLGHGGGQQRQQSGQPASVHKPHLQTPTSGQLFRLSQYRLHRSIL